MGTQVGHIVRRFAVGGLTCGLALLLAACTSDRFSAGAVAPDAKATPVSRVEMAVGVITDDYVDPVAMPVLVNACMRELPAQAAAPEGRTEETAGRSLKDIETLFAHLPAQDGDAAADSCIRSMVGTLGDRSQFLDTKDFRELQVDTPALGSLGLELAPAAEGAKILWPIEGAPAASAGIVAGDLITAIGDVELRNRPLSEIVRLLRGVPGSTATITVQRAGEAEPLHFTLNRQVIHFKAEGRLLEPGFIYLRLFRFDPETLSSIAETIHRLNRESKGIFLGVILDLRRCRGGLLHGAIGVSAAFLPAGTLVTETRGRTADSNRKYYADRRDYIRGSGHDPIDDLPTGFKSAAMVVMIGPNTAAGAEILVSALQDHKRATVIGERSFGRGTIETIVPLRPWSKLNQTAIKLSTARVYRPSGEMLEGKGVQPDVVVESPKQPEGQLPASVSSPTRQLDPSGDHVLAQALKILESAAAARR